MISYAPLHSTLHLKNKKKTDLLEGASISSSTLAKLSNDEYVSLEVINRICNYLGCKIEEVLLHIPDPKRTDDGNSADNQ